LNVNGRAVVYTVRRPRAESRLRHGSGVDDVQSDDGGYGRRGEVELQDLGVLGRGMQRRPSMPELVSHAGEKGGAQRSFWLTVAPWQPRSCSDPPILRASADADCLILN